MIKIKEAFKKPRYSSIFLDCIINQFSKGISYLVLLNLFVRKKPFTFIKSPFWEETERFSKHSVIKYLLTTGLVLL